MWWNKLRQIKATMEMDLPPASRSSPPTPRESKTVTHRCGWWIDTGAAPLAQALREAVALVPEQRATMGQRGRALVASNYSWDSIAEKMIEAYEWVLGRGARPRFVHLR
jgi:glycosyltransferase involved in cell wall biosynthesis